jgi:hypothetical protein
MRKGWTPSTLPGHNGNNPAENVPVSLCNACGILYR